MSIEFENDNSNAHKMMNNHQFYQPNESTGIAKWIINKSGGIIKTEKGADIFLLILVLGIFAVSAYLVFFGNSVYIPDSDRPHNNGKLLPHK